MLPYILAIAIAIYSLRLFSLAFFSPVIHRKDDFLWSGVALFYALVLWLCAGRITGAVLLGETAITILALSFGWQTLKLRRALAYPDEQREEFSVMQWVQNSLGSKGRKKPTISPTPSKEEPTSQQEEQQTQEVLTSPSVTVTEDETTPTVAQEILETATEENILTPVTPETDTAQSTPPKSLSEFPVTASVQESAPPKTQVPDKQRTPPAKTPSKKGFSFNNLFGLGKKRESKPKSKPETVTQKFPEIETEFSQEEEWDTPQAKGETIIAPQAPLTTQAKTEEPATSALSGSNLSEEELDTFTSDDEAETIIESVSYQEVSDQETSEFEFETFNAEPGAETLIESYKSDAETKEEKQNQSVETQENPPAKPTNKSEVKSEEKDENAQKSE